MLYFQALGVYGMWTASGTSGETQMRAAIARAGDIVVGELPEPEPALDQVLVKSLACGICGSDLHALHHGKALVALS
ncbi:MAG: D-arabinose 1-dehydrogenase-like Zn-dependent alcohol dehydrogenase [Gammaproteobacteria bacterium]|jgi:D-arabinose 1-dehydrogenase-like Zn-dependent alcohol dehydrogenase